jgi:death on curing protein
MVRFLDRDAVLAIHAAQLARFGGGDGLRDEGLLDSAIAQPMASFGDEYLHHGLHEMAAAYLFHIVKNHPFVDGNKRAGVVVALVFLEVNDVPTPTRDELYDITIAVADGSLSKADLAVRLSELFPLPSDR